MASAKNNRLKMLNIYKKTKTAADNCLANSADNLRKLKVVYDKVKQGWLNYLDAHVEYEVKVNNEEAAALVLEHDKLDSAFINLQVDMEEGIDILDAGIFFKVLGTIAASGQPVVEAYREAEFVPAICLSHRHTCSS